MSGSAFPRDGDGVFAGPSVHLIKIVIGEILEAALGPVPSTPVSMDV
ncbi:hypothetical protein ABTY61_19190 [Kitasatospora sp. NPDC096128]